MALSLASQKVQSMIAQIIMLHSQKNFVIILIKTLQFSSNLNVSFENIPYQDFNETYNCNF